MAVANVVAKFEADISDVQAKMAALKQSFRQVTDSTTAMSDRMQQVGEDMAIAGRKMSLGITLPLAAIGVAAVNAQKNFEVSMNTLGVAAGASAEEVAKLSEYAKQMGADTVFSAGEAADAMVELAKAGFTPAQIEGGGLAATMALAATEGMLLSDAATTVSNAMATFGLEAAEANIIADALAGGANASTASVESLTRALRQVGPGAVNAGLSLQETVAALSAFDAAGIKGSDAGTSLKTMLMRLVPPTQEAEAEMKRLGISFTNADGSFKSITEVAGILQDTFGDMNEAQRSAALTTLFGADATRAATVLMNQGAEGIQKYIDATNEMGGAQALADARMSGTAGALEELAGSLETAALVIGENLAPTIQTLAGFIKTVTDAFLSLPKPVQAGVVGFGAFAAAVGPILWIGGKLIAMIGLMGAKFTELKIRAIAEMKSMALSVRGSIDTVRLNFMYARTSAGVLGASFVTLRTVAVTSFRTIAAAAKGLMASMGPVGLAILGVTLALESFISSSMMAEQKASEYKETLDQLTGSATQATVELTALNLAMTTFGFGPFTQSMEQMGSQFGITLADMATAIHATQAEYDAFIEGIRAREGMPGAADTIIDELNAERAGIEAGRLAIENQNKAKDVAAQVTATAAASMNEFTASNIRAYAAAQNTTDAQDALNDAFDLGITAVEGLETAFLNMQDAMSDEASIDGAYRAINRLNDELTDGNKNLEGYSDGALDNREAIRQAAQAWMDYAAATSDPEEAQARLLEGQEQISKALTEAGIDPADSDIFKMLQAQQEQSKLTVDEFAAQRDKAAQYGNDVGKNFIDGIIDELERRRKEVADAAAAAAAALNTGGNAGIEANSPSRTAMRVAQNWTDGIIVGLRKNTRSVRSEAAKIGQEVADAFAALMRPRYGGGAAANAFEQMFGSREDIQNSARLLQDATWDLADARDAVVEAEKSLADARKAGNAREIAAAERDLARARRDAADAADAAKSAEFVAANRQALLALDGIVNRYDYITDALNDVQGALQNLTELTARPFGLESELSRMFGADLNPDQIASNFTSLTRIIRDAYAVLIDPKIVGRDASRANRRVLNATIRQIEDYVAQIITLRQEYDRNIIQEGVLKDELDKVTKAYDDATRDLERIVNERDGFVNKITDNFRKFVNNLSNLTDQSSREMKETVRDLGNGVKLIMQAADPTSAAGAIATNLRSRLDQVRKFATNIRTLMQRGLDPQLIREFIESGVSGAGDTVSALASATDDELRSINETQAALFQHAQEFAGMAGETFYGSLIADQQAVVGGLREEVNAANAALTALQARNTEIEGLITGLSNNIQTLIVDIASRLPAQTMEAGQKAVDSMIAGFREKFPEMKRYFNRLMDELARSMQRTVTVNVQAIGAVNAGRADARSFNTGTVPLATTGGAGKNVTIASNAVNVTVSGMTGTGNITEQVKRAVDESLQELAREIVAA